VPSSISSSIRSLVVGVIPTSPPCAVLDIAGVLSAQELSELAGNQLSE
jgi:hypothetical protein